MNKYMEVKKCEALSRHNKWNILTGKQEEMRDKYRLRLISEIISTQQNIGDILNTN